MPTEREIQRKTRELKKRQRGIDVDDIESLPGYSINRILAVGDPDSDLEEVWYDDELGVRKLSDGQLYRNLNLEPYIETASRGDGCAD